MPFTYTKTHTASWVNAQGGKTNQTDNVRETTYDSRSALRRTKKGTWRPPQPYSRYTRDGDTGACHLSGQGIWWGGDGVWSGNFAGYYDSSGYYYDGIPMCPAGVIQKAEIQALQALKAQRVNFGNALGERAQTAQLVGDTLHRLAGVVNAVRRMDPELALKRLDNPRYYRYLRNKIRNNVKTPFQLWLELQYGWKPFLSDADQTFKSLISAEDAARRVTASVRGKSFWVEESTTALSDGWGPHYVDYERYTKTKHKVFVRLDYEKNENPLLASASQLGLTNPLSIAWELTPWSFVADWFLPIGNYLDVLDADFGWTFKGGSRSVKSTMTTTPRNATVRSSYPPWPVYGYATASGAGRQMRFDRTVYNSSPVVGYPQDMTAFKTKSSGLHVMNGIALLLTAIGDGGRIVK